MFKALSETANMSAPAVVKVEAGARPMKRQVDPVERDHKQQRTDGPRGGR